MEEKREARANKKDINFGNDDMYEKIQFHVKLLANRSLLLVVNKHEISNCMYLILTRVVLAPFTSCHCL